MITRQSRQRLAVLGLALLGAFTAAGASGEPHAVLGLNVARRAVAGSPVTVPAHFAYFDTTITAMAFSIDIDTGRLSFDPTDDDMDGVPDAVTLPAGMPSVAFIDYDPSDDGGEIDIMLANLSGAPLPQGIILRFTFDAINSGPVSSWVRFSDDPPPSFGNAQGQNVDGATILYQKELFADGFESGDLSAWSRPGDTP